MIRTIVFFFCIFIFGETISQPTFIKSTTNTDFGGIVRVLPMADLGWVVCSLDSLNFIKYTNCGIIEWSRHYQIPNAIVSLTDIIKTKDDGIAMVTRIDNGNLNYSLITKLDAAGTILWSKSYEDVFYDQFPYSISEDSQGNLFVFANAEHLGGSPFYNMLIKVNSTGNLLWSKFYDHGGIWGGAITTSDDGVLIRTGSTFIKLDNAGTVQWTSYVSGMPYNYYAPVEVSDGYILTGTASGNQYISFYKIGKLGDQVWTDRKTMDIFGNPRMLKPRSNGNFTVLGVSALSGVYTTSIFEFDNDLNLVYQGGLSAAGFGLVGKDICFLSDNTPVVAGILNVGSAVFVAKTEVDFNSDCSFENGPITTNLDPVSVTNSSTNTIAVTLNAVNRTYSYSPNVLSPVLICPPSKYLTLGPDTSFCENSTLTLENKLPSFFENYLWSMGETTATISINQPGVYWLQAYDNCEQVLFTDTITVVMIPTVVPNLGEDLFLCEGEDELLLAPLCDSCTYLWSTGSTDDSIWVSTVGNYWLSIQNKSGCIGSDTIQVDSAKCECDIYLPNAFTPNEDGINEVFKPLLFCDLFSYEFSIYNRWGQKVFETVNVEDGWEGILNNQPAPEGVFVYRLKYTPILKGVMKTSIEKTGKVAVLY